MTQTEHLMASIVTHSHDIAALQTLTDRQTSGFAYSRLLGAIQTLKAERDIKRDTLSKLCKGWFE